MRSLTRPAARLVAIAVVALAALVGSLGGAGASVARAPHWTLTRTIHQPGGTMTGLACTSTHHCIATTFDGFAVSTQNGWTSFTKTHVHGTHFAGVMSGVACLSAALCLAVGGWGTSTTGYGLIARTFNGGSSWSAVHVAGPTLWPLWAISCPTATTCYAAGDRDGHTAYWTKTTSSGGAWADHVGIHPSVGVLDGISCDGTSFCAVVGSIDSSASTMNGGGSWSVGIPPNAVHYWYGISCLLASDCVAVGSGTGGVGVAYRSTDGGLHWASMAVPAGVQTLYAVTCVGTLTCFAVGRSGTTDENGHGVVLASSNGRSWSHVTIPRGAAAIKAIACRTASWCTAVGGTPQDNGIVLTYH